MKLNEIGSKGCPMAQALAEIGDSWSLLILREAFYGRTRFSDFVTHTGAQKTVVSARLKQLVEAGILTRETYSEFPTRHNYVLTEKGRDLSNVLVFLTQWGKKWIDEEQNVITVSHSCGHELTPSVHCGECGEEVTNDSIRSVPAT